MDDDPWKLKNSKFYHFGIVPRVCIHSPKPDQYSKMYVPRDACKCGCKEWVEGKMPLARMLGVDCMFKDVHRCNDCGEVRVADHVGKEEDQ